MIDEADLDVDKNDDGELVDNDGCRIYCDGCEAPATNRVVVSVDGPHDDVRDYCSGCYDVYTVGVQHGRYHEAALYGRKPGRDSSQDPPKAN
jgi:hypothetical protein